MGSKTSDDPKQPKLSFVIPAHNRAHLIVETLDSLVAQTESDWEAIVIDDHSTDDTAKIVRSHGDSRIKCYELPKGFGTGVAAARNYGNRMAGAYLIAVLDSDDLALPERAAAALASYDKHHWDMYSTSRITLDMETGERNNPLNIPEHWDEERFKKASYITHSTMVYTKKLAMEMPYNSAVGGVDDYDFISRLIAYDKKIIFDPIVTVIWRRHPHTLTADSTGQVSETLRLIRQWRGWEAKS